MSHHFKTILHTKNLAYIQISFMNLVAEDVRNSAHSIVKFP